MSCELCSVLCMEETILPRAGGAGVRLQHARRLYELINYKAILPFPFQWLRWLSSTICSTLFPKEIYYSTKGESEKLLLDPTKSSSSESCFRLSAGQLHPHTNSTEPRLRPGTRGRSIENRNHNSMILNGTALSNQRHTRSNMSPTLIS